MCWSANDMLAKVWRLTNHLQVLLQQVGDWRGDRWWREERGSGEARERVDGRRREE